MEKKRIFWQFEIEGAIDIERKEKKMQREGLEEFTEQQQKVSSVLRRVIKILLQS